MTLLQVLGIVLLGAAALVVAPFLVFLFSMLVSYGYHLGKWRAAKELLSSTAKEVQDGKEKQGETA